MTIAMQMPQTLAATLQSKGPSAKQMAQYKDAAENFESVFYGEMFSHMFKGVGVDPVFGGGHGEEIYRSMMIQEYGKVMAKSPSNALLTQQLEREMIHLQQNHTKAR